MSRGIKTPWFSVEGCLAPLTLFLHCYCLNRASSFSDPFILCFPPSLYSPMSPEPPYMSPASLHSPPTSKQCALYYFGAAYTFFFPPSKSFFCLFFTRSLKKGYCGVKWKWLGWVLQKGKIQAMNPFSFPLRIRLKIKWQFFWKSIYIFK